jgi:hypothetical protein
MKWILIAFFINHPTLTVEFDSLSACQRTGEKLKKEHKLGAWLYYCEEKK